MIKPIVAGPLVCGIVLAKLEMLGGRDLLAQLIDGFLANAPRRLAEMLRARRTGDLAAMGDAAHGVASTAGHLGALGLSECARNLERLARAGEADAAAETLEELDALLTLVRAKLHSVREDLAA